MSTENFDINDYEVSRWLEETHWPSRESDIQEMIMIYEWWLQTSPRCPQTNTLDEELLVQMTLSRMRQIHTSHRDACVITALLIMQTAFMAKRQGIKPPIISRHLH